MSEAVSPIANAKLSIIIGNYNYQNFLPATVDSALAVEWPNKEVIVVDNGSTDDSRRVIESYGDRIIPIFKEHGGQYTGSNTGFAASTGDVIILLDSDDTLAPSIMHEIAAAWTPDTAKAQVLMQTIDGEGKPFGSIFPQLTTPPSPDQIAKWQRETGFYPTPPASGNIYARKYLAQIFPLKFEGTQSTDAYCIAAAPSFGDVVTIAKPLSYYRVHGTNMSAMSGSVSDRLRGDLERAIATFDYAKRQAEGRGFAMSGAAPWNSLWLLPYRVASWKLDPAAHPVAGDNLFHIFADTIKACFTPQGHGRTRFMIAAWAAVVAVLPKGMSRHVVLWRFSPQSRPRFLQTLVQRLGVIQRAKRNVEPDPAEIHGQTNGI